MKILFCGLGGIGQRHLRNLRQLLGDELQVHAYRVRGQRIKLRDNLTVDEGADLERDYAIVVHHDLAEALAEKPAAALICNPNSLHVPVALECVRAGVPVFMEKPLASDLAGIDQLLAEAEQRRGRAAASIEDALRTFARPAVAPLVPPKPRPASPDVPPPLPGPPPLPRGDHA